jgi:DNA-binding GntR family transcriptional regulator
MLKKAPQLVENIPRPVSLRDRAYRDIKRRINRLEDRPGAYLNEAHTSRPWCGEPPFGLSRARARELKGHRRK